jgi:hypothetical protein
MEHFEKDQYDMIRHAHVLSTLASYALYEVPPPLASYRGTLLIRIRTHLGPYSRPMPVVLRRS